MKSEEPGTCSTSGALQCLEPLQGDSAGPGDKLQQPSPHLLVVPLHDPPEPDHLGALRSAVFEASVALPVREIYLVQSSDNLTRDLGFKYNSDGFWLFYQRVLQRPS